VAGKNLRQLESLVEEGRRAGLRLAGTWELQVLKLLGEAAFGAGAETGVAAFGGVAGACLPKVSAGSAGTSAGSAAGSAGQKTCALQPMCGDLAKSLVLNQTLLQL